MRRQVVAGEIGGDVGLCPVGKRVHLHPPVRFALNRRERGAGAPLEPLAPGDPGRETGERRVERFDLALPAAAIRVVAPQLAGRIDNGDSSALGPCGADVTQPEPGGQGLAILQGLGKQLARVEEDYRCRAVDRRHHVQQHRAFRAEGRDERDPAGKAGVQCPAEQDCREVPSSWPPPARGGGEE
jgi:hypothetical protein